MSFQVLWKPTAERALATLWTDSPDRDAVADAADAIDRLLRDRPHDQGESRGGATRVMFEGPLGVSFDIDDGARTVHVLTLWRSR